MGRLLKQQSAHGDHNVNGDADAVDVELGVVVDRSS